jgi:hypothetical protein
LEEVIKEMDCFIRHCYGESETVGDGEKLFGDNGERFQVAVVVTVVEKFEDDLP